MAEEVASVCIVCNESFLYTRRTTYQLRVTCGKKLCITKAQQLSTPGRVPWRTGTNTRTFFD